MAQQASGMTESAFHTALQNFVESLRATDQTRRGNMVHGFGMAAPGHITVTPELASPFRAALSE
eukprot:8155677-Alexandrium_andersonii.AAC.1